MTVGPDLRTHALAADKRIVLRHRTVGIESDNFAERHREILRLITMSKALAHDLFSLGAIGLVLALVRRIKIRRKGAEFGAASIH